MAATYDPVKNVWWDPVKQQTLRGPPSQPTYQTEVKKNPQFLNVGELWKNITSPHKGSWGLPDFGLTEFVKPVYAADKPVTNLGSYPGPAAGGGGESQPSGGSSTKEQTISNMVSRGGYDRKTAEQVYSADPGRWDREFGAAAAAAEEAARKAAERERQAAIAAFEAKKKAAESAKSEAKGTYDWIIDTLGSNKKDLLAQVATARETGLKEYGQQEEKTKRYYDKAKQDTLIAYRDLRRKQEKLMRASGLQSSSRAREADMRLNNLLAKDISTVSTQEADSLALIANAVTTLKRKSSDMETQIKNETKSKMDKAALDYQAAVNAINNNLLLSEAEKAAQIRAAEATPAA